MKTETVEKKEASSGIGSSRKGGRRKAVVQIAATQRGLGAFAPAVAPPDTPSSSGALVQLVPLDAIVENPANARRVSDKEELESLAQSIRERGLIQPIVVRSLHNDGRFVIVAGHRRYRAHQMLGLAEIPALVRVDADEAGDLSDMAVENLQRTQLAPIEEARAFANLVEQGLTQEQVAQTCGVGVRKVQRRLNLLRLPDPIARRVGQDGFSQEHAEKLLPLADKPDLLEVAAKVIGEESTYGDGMPDADEFGSMVARALENAKLVRALPYPHEIDQLKEYDSQLAKKLKALPTVKLDARELVLDAKALNEATLIARQKLQEERVKEAKKNGPARRVDYALEDQISREMRQVWRGLIEKAVKGVLAPGTKELRVILHAAANGADKDKATLEFLSRATDLPLADVSAILAGAGEKRQKATDALLKAKDQTPLHHLIMAASLDTIAGGYAYGGQVAEKNAIMEAWTKKGPAEVRAEAKRNVLAARKEAAAGKGKGTPVAGPETTDENDGEGEEVEE